MTAISNSRVSDLHSPQLAKADPTPSPAHLEIATELAGRGGSLQQRGDRKLLEFYTQDLKELSAGNQDYRQATVERIPPHSSFGQSRALLDSILKSPAFQNWAKENDVDLSKEITINLASGTIGFTTMGTKPRNPFDFSPPKPSAGSADIHSFMGWPLLKSAANTLAGSGNVIKFDPATTATSAKVAEIAQFHGHTLPFDSTLSPAEQQAAITQYINKWEHKDDLFPENVETPSQKHLESQASQLGDLNNRSSVIAAITKVADSVVEGLEDHDSKSSLANEKDHAEYNLIIKQRINAILDTPIQIDPASSYFKNRNLKPGVAVTLRDYLVGSGISLPANETELKSIAQSLASPPIETPMHGNLGGALSWPTPMSNADQRALISMTNKFLEGQPERNLLDYLTRGLDLGDDVSNDRSSAIDRILKSPNAEIFARAAEREFGEIASPDVIAEWVLTALYTSMDALGVNTTAPDSSRTKVAGFDLAHVNLSGKNIAEIHKELAHHLLVNKIASVENLELAMEILLSRKAPELLVKEIPDTLVKGTHSWVSFTTAVARLEAEAPGSTNKMTYAQVMMRNELAPITLADKLVEQQAQSDALKDWGVQNGVLDWNSTDSYSEEDMAKVRAAFKDQVDRLNEASNAFAKMPPNLHDMTMAYIKELNPHLSEEQIKQKVLTPKESTFFSFPGPYSLLDVFIHTAQLHKEVDLHTYTSSDKNIDLSTITAPKFEKNFVNSHFEGGLRVYLDSFEQGTQSQVKHLISKLPLEDRKIIEHGKISVSKEVDVTYTPYSQIQEQKDSSTTSVFVQSEVVDARGNKRTHTYEIDSAKNTIRKRPDLDDTRPGPIPDDKRNAKHLVPLVPDGDYKENVLSPWPDNSPHDAPNSFSSEKTQYIADAMVKKINIRGYADELRGTTTFDGELPFYQKLEDFVLGLIPGYNAITNFIKGNWREGLIDLAFDAFGFILAGAGGAARAAGAGVRTATSTLGSTAKKLLRGAIGALNPIDAQGLLLAGVQEGISYLASRGPEGNNQPRIKINYDPVKIFRNVENATVGSATMQGSMTKIAATQKNGKWYALDPVSKQPYGLPLKDFVPSA
ncbi:MULTISPECIES: hypothetical protein [unclassified Pseudomonas]|uniref:hypothetical protein n=1 Tax=unclassified Pseudomonas TaxID=196821 RepID=UPI00249BD764|nr:MULTISPECIES: hypothetical protein [unclassified Pseudomonas]MDI3250649.1 hypothetical protein [Pseudomonas sp. AL10]MDI3268404.1 hypothetical protein [Pseudomonas sp. AL15]